MMINSHCSTSIFSVCEGRRSYSYCHTNHHFDIFGWWMVLKIFFKTLLCTSLHSNVNMQVSFATKILFEPFFCGSEYQSFLSILYLTLAFIAKFFEKLFNFEIVFNFMLNCWDMAPEVPHI